MSNETSGTTPTIDRRYIGRRFLSLRLKAKLTREQVAKALGNDVSSTTLGRIEQGHPGVRLKQSDVRSVLELYGASPEELEVLLGLAAQTRTSGGYGQSWWHDKTDGSIPEWFSLYVALEDEADTLQQWQPENVPGLLQTEAYARAVVSVATDGDREETERRVKVRMERQELLRRPRAPQLKAILNEAALHRVAGSGDLAREQLQHLIHVSHFPNVILRLLPYSSGMHGGMTVSGGFSLLRFPVDPVPGEAKEPSLAYADTLTGAIYLSNPDDVGIYDRVWSDMESKSQDPPATRLAITTLMEGLPQ